MKEMKQNYTQPFAMTRFSLKTKPNFDFYLKKKPPKSNLKVNISQGLDL